MKLALISYAKLKGDKYWNLILETQDDVQEYFEASFQLGAKQFLDVWVALKGGQTWPHYVDQRIHQASVSGAMKMISMKAEETGECSLVEACEINDKLLLSRLKSMINLVSNGEKIRVSSKGGYSIFDDFYQTHQEVECSEKQMREYLMSKDGIKFELEFSSPIIIIENESIISDQLYRKIESIKGFETIFDFKYRTENWTAEEFYKLFNDAVKKGLHTIIAETSINDEKQFESLAELLKKVMMNNSEKELEVKILTSNTKLLEKHTQNLPGNLKLTVL
jgi:hypothetical protein